MAQWKMLEGEAKKAVEARDEDMISAIRRRMNLLNPCVLVPPGEVSDVWRWCLENLNVAFHRWRPEDVDFYEKLFSESPNLLEKTKAAYALWTLTKKYEHAEATVQGFLEAARLYMAKSWYEEAEMVAFCFEFAAALSLKLSMKTPIDIVSIIGELARTIRRLDSNSIRGLIMIKLTDAAARLADRVGNMTHLEDGPKLKQAFSEILDVSLKLAGENPLNERYLETCMPLSAVVNGPQEIDKFKEKIADTIVKRAEDQKSGIGKMALHQQALKLYAEAGATEKLERSKLAVRQALGEAEEKGEFKTITVKSRGIPQEKIVDPYIAKLSSKSPHEALGFLARDLSGIPQRKKVEEQTREMLSKSPGLFLTSVIPFEGELPKGRLTNDEAKVQFKIDQNLTMQCRIYEIARAEVMKALFEKLAKPEDLVQFLDRAQNMTATSKRKIAKGVEHHFKREHEASISILIPQVEEVLRTVLKNKGVLSSKYTTRDQGLQERMIDDLLEDATGHLDEDLVEYLRVRLTHGRSGGGSNVRNQHCHGWMEADQYTETLSWALVDALLTLGVV